MTVRVDLSAEMDVSSSNTPEIKDVRAGLTRLLKVAPATAKITLEKYYKAPNGGWYHRLAARWSQYV